MKKSFINIVLLTALSTMMSLSFAQKQIALTIDDLPFVGEQQNFHLNMIVEALKASEVPATGFIIASEVTPKNVEALKKFRDAGLGLGNHTFHHTNLNKVKTNKYIQEIDEADKLLLPVLTEPKFFRYPYLAVSSGDKKNTIEDFLYSKNYQIAPVTIDSKDFIFNQLLMSVQEKDRRTFLSALKDCYLQFIWEQTLQAEERNRKGNKPERTQILLIHANLLNAYVLPDIINLYKQNGYSFVSLEKALKTFPKQAEPIKVAETQPPSPPPSVWKEPGWKEPVASEAIDDFVAWD